ncbi:hypothetical protein [Leuconostoc mesenteroides]|uniref:hypothetical protein n=1 Tax=Leuconostoc TaxID=1243 RepID=UPI001CBCC6D6|nr:hypothetical protein [Leuconostoc mesenteroides]MCM6831381.1 hypothetical protein [Leuconostoc mesenteroides]MDP0486090.1 hypothetical protein [Leuconostoc mesenteroides]MDV8928215.1 hypothetical protein [Leuconostoc mesenteroides]WMS40715.1 hypothetical protein Q8F54_00505 [Leuconostoc mesenteroides]
MSSNIFMEMSRTIKYTMVVATPQKIYFIFSESKYLRKTIRLHSNPKSTLITIEQYHYQLYYA